MRSLGIEGVNRSKRVKTRTTDPTATRHPDPVKRDFGAIPSIGTVGHSFDNALAETMNGCYKAEIVQKSDRPGPWKAIEESELTTLGRVHWNNNERLHGFIGDVPSAEFEETFYASTRQGQALAP